MLSAALAAGALLACGLPAAAPAAAAKAPAFARHLLPADGFGQSVETVAAGDLNGDGRPDIVVAGDRYLLRYATPSSRPVLIAHGTFGAGAAMVIRDVDGDGRLDIVTGEILPSGERREVWLANTPHGWRLHVLSNAFYCHDLVFAAFAAGGATSAACVDQHAPRIVLLAPAGQATAPWASSTVDPAVNAMGLAVADIDRDGRLDLVAGRSWYRNDPGGGWTRYRYTSLASAEFPAFDDYAKVAVRDLNGDGRPDIVASLFAESPRGRLYAFLAPSDPRSSGWRPVLLDGGPLFGVHSLVTGSFDGCARPEVVVADTNAGGWDFGVAPDPHVLLFRLLPGGWSRTVVDSVGAHDLQVADLDRDGLPDLLGHEENTDRLDPPRDGRVWWWRNLGPRAPGCTG